MTDPDFDPEQWRLNTRKLKFKKQLLIFLIVISLIWLFWLVENLHRESESFVYPWPFFIVILWGLFLIGYYWFLFKRK